MAKLFHLPHPLQTSTAASHGGSAPTAAPDDAPGAKLAESTGQAEANAPGTAAIFVRDENHAIDNAHAAPVWVKLSPFIPMLLGPLAAYITYIRSPALPGRLAEANRPLYLFLPNKRYFDDIYDAVPVNPTLPAGRSRRRRGDGVVIDGTIDGLATRVVPYLTGLAKRLQSGYIYTYAFTMVIGITLLVTWMTLTGGAR